MGRHRLLAMQGSFRAFCSELEGIKRNPPSLYELRSGRLAIPFQQNPVGNTEVSGRSLWRWTDHPYNPDNDICLRSDQVQAILAKANKRLVPVLSGNQGKKIGWSARQSLLEDLFEAADPKGKAETKRDSSCRIQRSLLREF